jgi:hypothetical protein
MGHYLSEMNGSPDIWSGEKIYDESYLTAGEKIYRAKGNWGRNTKVMYVERFRNNYDKSAEPFYEIHCQTGASLHFISCSLREFGKALNQKVSRSGPKSDETP